jgi:hypothetical protein
MGKVEAEMLDYIKMRLNAGVLSVSKTEIMSAVIPQDHPEFRSRPAYMHGLERLRRRHVINAVDDVNGMTHYFIGNFASEALRKSLGL